MEMPPYRRPNLRNLASQIYEQSRAFVVRAGSVILALAVVLWALSYYPRSDAAGAPSNRVAASEQLEGSYLGQAGKFLEPATRHLGWDWRISVAVLASFPAREVIVSTLGTLFQLGSDVTEESVTLLEKLRGAKWQDGPLAGRPLFNLPVALSVMVFFALCCQCMATLATIRRETNSWTWPAFVFTYMTVLAVAGAWGAFHLGLALNL
jgi:ferrous iron transport protein B